MVKKDCDKYRQKVAFNIVKACLLNELHNPFELQEKLLCTKLPADLDLRTFKTGWHNKTIPKEKTLKILDKIVLSDVHKNSEIYKKISLNTQYHNLPLSKIVESLNQCEEALNNDSECEENLNSELKKDIFYANTNICRYEYENAKAAIDTFKENEKNHHNKDQLSMAYFPGVVLKASAWLSKSQINDPLHLHFLALDVLFMSNHKDLKLKKTECENILEDIHQRWNPTLGNAFFESVDIDESEYQYLLPADFKNNKLDENIGRDGLYYAVLEPIIYSPKCLSRSFDPIDKFKIIQFLASIPLSNNVEKNPLIDLFVLDFASATAVFMGLFDNQNTKNEIDCYEDEKTNGMNLGYDLFWSENSISSCLANINITTRHPFYNEHYRNFEFIRNQYEVILNRFGIKKSEVLESVDTYIKKQITTFNSKKTILPVTKKYNS